ncbi:unnamed protein product [Trifolium pratense]|uniref:Uncharacterized protein n=1 Tax=Trifolium pratense TaxID=57577 RepID=A0ACB0L3W4_TRIPR|nr:unnamed protein product [Trifolium pratense]
MACESMLSMCLELSAGVLNHDLQVPKPECSEKLQNFPTRKQNYAENIYTEGNHAARGNRITRRVIKSENNLLLQSRLHAARGQSYAARGQVREQPSS